MSRVYENVFAWMHPSLIFKKLKGMITALWKNFLGGAISEPPY